MKRINFTHWGRGRRPMPAMPAWAMAKEEDEPIEAVARAIAKKTGLVVCGGPRDDGWAIDRGRHRARHYQLTLGRPVGGGGYTPEVEIWVSIPVGGTHADR